MAYSKQTWVTGDTITAEKLNHMEDGIAIESSIILSGEPAPDNSGVRQTTDDMFIDGAYILMSDAQIGDFLFTSSEIDGAINYYPITSVSTINVSPNTRLQDSAYTISEPMDGIMVTFDGGGLLVLPTSTEWVSVENSN